MAPLVLGSLIGAASSLIDNLFTSHANNLSYVNQQRFLNRQLQFNHDEAQLQRDFTAESIRSARAYNDPSQAMGRLTSAGLNPNLVAGNNMAAGISDAATGGNNNAASPGLSAPSVDALSVGSAAEIAKTIAETRKIEQDTNKGEAETSILWNERKWQDALNQKTLETQNSVIELNKELKTTEQNKQLQLRASVRQFDQQIQESKQKIKESTARILQMNEETRKSKIDNQFRASEYKARIAKYYSDIKYNRDMANVSQGQLSLAIQMAAYQAADLEASAEMKRAMATLPEAQRTLFESLAKQAGANTEKINFDLSQEKTWQDTERALNAAKTGVSIITDVVNLFFKPIEVGAKVLGAL